MRFTWLPGVLAVWLAGCTSFDSDYNADRVPSAPSDYYRHTSDQTASEQVPTSEEKLVKSLPDDGTRLTLADCIGAGLERNPATRSAWQAAKAAAARIGEERAAYLPSASIRAESGRGKTVSLDSDTEKDARDVYGAGIDVSYLLFDGGARRARVDGAEAALLEANFRHNTTLQDVALAVEEAYYELLGAKWSMKVAEQTVKRTQHQLEMARARHDAGTVTRADVLRAETQRANAELLRVKARGDERVARGKLGRAMGVAVNAEFDVADPGVDIRQLETERIETLLAEAVRQRPELQAALARVKNAQAATAEARSAWWPDVRAGVSAGRRDTSFAPERDEWNAGITLSWPLFTGFQRSRKIERTQAELDRAAAEHADLLQGVELDVWTAYWRLIEAGEAVDAAAKVTASADESARLVESEYKNGIATIVDLVDAQSAQTEAENTLVQSRLDWYTAKAQFERAVGRSLASSKLGSSGF